MKKTLRKKRKSTNIAVHVNQQTPFHSNLVISDTSINLDYESKFKGIK